ncbi:MAG: PadR family transcriptional regulator [Anaerolineae bacterium]|nr:PadR family transcriptional regulator [Anaerolineae bacterium]
MTNAEIAILSLVSERPLYGYQVEQLIEQRGMREWAEIGFSSIYYILNKLEENGCLTSEKFSDGDRPARKVYNLTPMGLAQLREAVRQRLRCPRPRSSDLDLALAALPVLSPAEALLELRICRDDLQSRFERVNAKREKDRQMELPYYVEALFDHSLKLMQAELAWVNSFIQQIESMESINERD